MTTVRGVLLDVDGTLIDSNDAHARAWVQALAESGRAVPVGAVRRLIGKGGDKLLPEVSGLDAASDEGKRVSARRQAIFLTEFAPRLRPCRGATPLLAELARRGVKLAVASSAKKAELDPLLKLCGADEFVPTTTSADDADESKPDPDILHAAIERVGVSADQVVMLGDTPYDVEAARRAGVRVIAVRCGGWGDAELKADEVYDDPADLLANLDSSLLAR